MHHREHEPPLMAASSTCAQLFDAGLTLERAFFSGEIVGVKRRQHAMLGTCNTAL